MPRQRITARVAVRPDLLKRYHEQFPGTGSLSWLLETAISEVLVLTDGQPALVDLVRGAIRSSILRERLINREPIAKRDDEPIQVERV